MSNRKKGSQDTKNDFTNKKRKKDSEETNNTTIQNTNNINDNDTDEDNKEDDIDDLFDEEKKIGEIEYTKNLIKALREAIEENDKLRQYAFELTKENEELKKEISEKDDVIRELAQYYQYCQTYHLSGDKEEKNNEESNNETSQKKKRKKKKR